MSLDAVLQALDEEMVRDSADPLYHVTYYGRLYSIAEDGLQPDMQRAIGSPAYDAHARGRVFLTEAPGVPYWMNRAEDFAGYNSDDPYEDGLVPVTLRVASDCIDNDKLKLDALGTDDARADAWVLHEGVPGECLEVYSGNEWLTIEDWERIDPSVAFNEEHVLESDEDEPHTERFFKTESPLNPFPY